MPVVSRHLCLGLALFLPFYEAPDLHMSAFQKTSNTIIAKHFRRHPRQSDEGKHKIHPGKSKENTHNKARALTGRCRFFQRLARYRVHINGEGPQGGTKWRPYSTTAETSKKGWGAAGLRVHHTTDDLRRQDLTRSRHSKRAPVLRCLSLTSMDALRDLGRQPRTRPVPSSWGAPACFTSLFVPVWYNKA